tara:strand:- start:1205 stop:1555 length:351 start_codon:yes stop_codon:yes gene_type:complete
MNTFKTKYKSCSTTIDELQYVSQGDPTPNSYNDNAPKERKANYNINNVKAVSGGKTVQLQQEQLSGQGVLKNKKIYNTNMELDNVYVDAVSPIGQIKNYAKRRLFKKNNTIYDLIS